MDDEDRYTRITLRIPKDVHARLSAQAESTSKSLNAEIVGRLQTSFDGGDSSEVDGLERELQQLDARREMLQSLLDTVRYYRDIAMARAMSRVHSNEEVARGKAVMEGLDDVLEGLIAEDRTLMAQYRVVEGRRDALVRARLVEGDAAVEEVLSAEREEKAKLEHELQEVVQQLVPSVEEIEYARTLHARREDAALLRWKDRFRAAPEGDPSEASSASKDIDVLVRGRPMLLNPATGKTTANLAGSKLSKSPTRGGSVNKVIIAGPGGLKTISKK